MISPGSLPKGNFEDKLNNRPNKISKTPAKIKNLEIGCI